MPKIDIDRIDGAGGLASGDAGGQLDGTYPNPIVVGITETSGPTQLTIGSIQDGELLVRSGTTITSQSASAPAIHAYTHEDGGADEISVVGLSGLLADAQTPITHASTHEDGGADEIDVGGLSGLLADPQTPLAHASTHHKGGSDELVVQELGSDGAAAGRSLRTDGSGGWSLVTPITTTVSGVKAGIELVTSFSGTPKKTTVLFSAPFPTTDYSVTLAVEAQPNKIFMPGIENRNTTSFDINMQTNNISKLLGVNWHATLNGEQP